MNFYPMTKTPERASDLLGIREDFSITVLLFDKEEPTYFDLGYYDYEKEEWEYLGDTEMEPICWCYCPNPTEYLKSLSKPTYKTKKVEYTSTTTLTVKPYNQKS